MFDMGGGLVVNLKCLYVLVYVYVYVYIPTCRGAPVRIRKLIHRPLCISKVYICSAGNEMRCIVSPKKHKSFLFLVAITIGCAAEVGNSQTVTT